MCVTCHINGAYISAPSSVHYSFRVGKRQCPRQYLTYAIHTIIRYKQNGDDTQQKFNVHKRIQCKQNNFGEVKTNGGDFEMIHGELSAPFIIVVQVSRVCHQPDTFSPARLYNPLLYVPFQYLYPRSLHLPKKFTPLLIFDSFPFNLYDL